MNLGIEGRKAIICASSEGLGRACAFSLAREGCDVVINGRRVEPLEETAAAIRAETGVSVTAVAADVSTRNGQQALLAACPAPDILVNNNGGPPRRDWTELDRAAIAEGIVQNLTTPIELMQATVPGMAERGFGRVVNITSLSVLMPIEGLDLSSAARAGLTAFLAGIRPLYAGRNVTINNLLPGKMDTKRLQGGISASADALGLSYDAAARLQLDAIPAKRFGTAHEFGETCAFVCSAQASYMTGQNILLDGGLFPHAF